MVYVLSQLREHEMGYLTYELKLSIVEHGDTIYLDIRVTSTWIIGIQKASILSWVELVTLFLDWNLIMTWSYMWHLQGHESLFS